MWFSIKFLTLLAYTSACNISETKVSGSRAPKSVCSGDLVFEDNFDEFDFDVWQHEITLSGGGNWEFQYYDNNRTNSYTHDGVLFIKPSLTADQFGEAFLSNGRIQIDGGTTAHRCTDSSSWGCERIGTPTNILNPIKSARIRTVESFNFRYGKVEIRAKMPAGDWLWPAIWLLPTKNAYGNWPASGEIDLVESRGNRKLYKDDKNIGVEGTSSTLHFGPFGSLNAYHLASWTRNNPEGYDNDFHRFQLLWTPDTLTFSIDDVVLGNATPGSNGFWDYGEFQNYPNISNPWRYGSKMAPFDQQFYLIINLAVGGANGFMPDDASNPQPKPWSNQSPTAATDFWKAKDSWLPTWNQHKEDGEGAALKVDYVRVWAL
ncbi:beta-1,3-glucan-binding protein-like [Aricia agestis]|uniref:beta-1,3-glucan-binding protein-like n=1 Tax=Aricia agestis TaxID=91739 RepID=UPI001C2097DE|nr:beta-1,3-glucan-binding protein-like [Aricia agestis]